ncbi:MAG: MurR/RpiR family transcriptional regulator [Pseudomonadota bacterium]
MNGTNVSNSVLDRLAAELSDFTPETRKAATYVLENPRDVSVSTVREIAEAAQVKPNTMVRMARAVGFEGYDDFRAPFRDEVRRGTATFPDRARWLQGVAERGEMGQLYAEMVGQALQNVEDTFAGISEAELRAAARMIWASRQVFVLGVGVMNANARNFASLAATGMPAFHAIPRAGSTATDDLAWANDDDVLIAMTFKPFRSEVVDAVEQARQQGMKVVALSDSPASPIFQGATHRFLVGTETPQFFPSSVALLALLETLLSFVIAVASPEVVDRVDRFHARRHALGIYKEDGA